MSPDPTRLAGVFAALGDETRLELVSRLSNSGPLSITRLASGAGITRQAITKHLQVLAGAGLAQSTRHGREQIWTLDTREIERALDQLSIIARRWDKALDRLKMMVEEQE